MLHGSSTYIPPYFSAILVVGGVMFLVEMGVMFLVEENYSMIL